MNVSSISANENITICSIDDNQDTLNSAEPVNNSQLNTKFVSKNFVKYFHNSSQLEFDLIDENNNPIANQSITLFIHGVNYTRVTNENGTGKMDINLVQGNYTANLIFIGNSKYKSTNSTISLKVLPLITANDMTKYFRNGTSFVANVFNYDGNHASNSKITFNINGVLYNRTTNNNGSAYLNINLAPGNYIITSMHNGCFISNNITVLSLIESNNLIKYFRNSSQFIVKVFNGNGNIEVNKTVLFNVDGFIYRRVTDVFGTATLNINFPTGEYIITTTFGNFSVSNSISVLSTIETKDIELTTYNRIPFTTTILNGEGKPIAGESLFFEINGMRYNRISNEDGFANLNINLNPGKYNITTFYNGLSQSNIITILD